MKPPLLFEAPRNLLRDDFLFWGWFHELIIGYIELKSIQI
jgi:hypothetical protein